MSIDVTFLGQAYSFGDDLKEYVDAMRLSEEIVDRAMQAFLTVAKKNNGFIDAVDLKPHLITIADAFIKRLCNKGVFSRSAEDYVEENEGYRQIQQICEEGTSVYKNILVDEINEFQDGMNDAYADAASGITGSGVRVFTSSLATLALTSAYEYSVLKGQAKKADEQYKKAIDALSDRTEARSNQRKNEYLEKIYFPKMTDAITLFSYTLSQKYIEDLISEGKFDDTVLEHTQIKKSNTLIENLKHISDDNQRIECIKQAFVACPFNEYVYYEAANTTIFDNDTFNAAKKWNCDDKIVEYLWKQIEVDNNTDLKSYYKKYRNLISSYAVCDKSDEEYVLFKLTSKRADKIVSEYRRISNFSNDNFILLNDIMDMGDDELSSFNNDDILGIIESKVKRIVSFEEFELLIKEFGHDKLIGKINTAINSSKILSSKKEIDDYIIKNAYELILPAVEKKKENIISAKEKIEEIKKAEEKSYNSKHRLFFVLLPFLILIPIIAYEIAAFSWTAQAEKYVNDFVEEQINSDLFSIHDWNKKINLDKGYTINSISYYYAGAGHHIYLSPHLTLYSDLDFVSNTETSLIAFDICYTDYYKKYNTAPPSLPIFALGSSGIQMQGYITIKLNNGESKTSEPALDVTTSPINPYCPPLFIVIYIIYIILIIVFYKKKIKNR